MATSFLALDKVCDLTDPERIEKTRTALDPAAGVRRPGLRLSSEKLTVLTRWAGLLSDLSSLRRDTAAWSMWVANVRAIRAAAKRTRRRPSDAEVRDEARAWGLVREFVVPSVEPVTLPKSGRMIVPNNRKPQIAPKPVKAMTRADWRKLGTESPPSEKTWWAFTYTLGRLCDLLAGEAPVCEGCESPLPRTRKAGLPCRRKYCRTCENQHYYRSKYLPERYTGILRGTLQEEWRKRKQQSREKQRVDAERELLKDARERKRREMEGMASIYDGLPRPPAEVKPRKRARVKKQPKQTKTDREGN